MLKTLYPIQTSFSIYTTLANPQLLSITHETEAFCLSQRYNSVTILAEALSLLDLKKKFPLAKMKEIQDLLNANGTQYVTFDEIEETIFHKKFDKERKAPLLKLKQDILE